MEKHTPYFQVLETFQKAQHCGLCILEKDAVRSYFDAFLYENVNDPSSRKVLRDARGYCPYHTYYLTGFHDILAFSILYKEQSLLAASFLESHGNHKNLMSEWERHDMCPACRQTIQIRQHYLGILAKGLVEQEMQQAFLGNFKICLHHLLMIMDEVEDAPLKKKMAEAMITRLKTLAEQQEQYCQDSQQIAIGKESDSSYRYSWVEAVEIAVGQKDVFEPLM